MFEMNVKKAEQRKSCDEDDRLPLPGDSFIIASVGFVYCARHPSAFIPLALFEANVENKKFFTCPLNTAKERKALVCSFLQNVMNLFCPVFS